MTVSLKRNQGWKPQKQKMAKLSVPDSGPSRVGKITVNTKVYLTNETSGWITDQRNPAIDPTYRYFKSRITRFFKRLRLASSFLNRLIMEFPYLYRTFFPIERGGPCRIVVFDRCVPTPDMCKVL